METLPLVDKYDMTRMLESQPTLEDLTRCHLHGRVVSDLVFSDKRLYSAHFSNASLIQARVLETIFFESEFSFVSFQGAYFNHCSWDRCNFVETVFRNCVLDHCKFEVDEALFRKGGLRFEQCLFIGLLTDEEKRLRRLGIELENSMLWTRRPQPTPEPAPTAIPPAPNPSVQSASPQARRQDSRFAGLEV